ncbi:MAG: hypothetical protein K5989_12865 [Lachnospiraceae bacterium]|nr:hypothetical protein [Lachnospiraceae bacterium]
MNKAGFIGFSFLLILAAAGCGKASKDMANTGQVGEPVSGETARAVALQIPVVKDGIMEPGEEAIEVVFEWEAVEGADGYEILEESKYRTEETFREPENEVTADTSQTTYRTGAQDEFDFRIKVRAYNGKGDDREYSEWSDYAYGSAYDKDSLTEEE